MTVWGMTLELGEVVERPCLSFSIRVRPVPAVTGFSERRDHEVRLQFRQLPGTTRQCHGAGLGRAIDDHMAVGGVAVGGIDTMSVSSPSVAAAASA